MKSTVNKTLTLALVVALMISLPLVAQAGKDKDATAEQMAGLESMCAASADARAARHMENSLYKRLGGYDKILELTTEIIRLHSINPQIVHTLDGVDHAQLAKHVADFMAAGTGGHANYQGRSMPAAHKHLDLNDAHFLAAGGDVMKAMTTLGYEQEEIDEVVCILVSLKDQVVFK
jgi:hemoglobin